MTTDTGSDGEHFLTESMGLFSKTIYECRHCGVRSPDDKYFDDINCPPTINDDERV